MGIKTEELKALCASLGRKYVGFRGNPRAPLWFIGEAPGSDEDQAGVPFVGSSGRELDRMLNEAGLSLADCCFVNPYKVRPPNNDITKIEETGISKHLFEEQFFEELTEYRPPFLAVLGGTPLRLLCDFTIDPRDKESKISKWRGSLLTSNNLQWTHYIVPNFHPAYILREWSDRDVAVFVFRRLREEFEYWKANAKHQPLPERELITEPSFDTAREFLCELIEVDKPISIDIELLARRVPYTVAFSNDPLRAISVELFGYSSQQVTALWRLIDKILATKTIVGQNFLTFDINWLQAVGFSVNVNNVHDTLVRHHVLYPEMSHKLDFQAMQFTREPYWKDEGKGWRLREGISKLMRYNAKDAAVTLEIFYEQEKEFADLCGATLGTDGLIREVRMDVGLGSEPSTTTDILTRSLEEKLTESADVATRRSSVLSHQTTRSIINAKTYSVSTPIISKLSTKDFTEDSITTDTQRREAKESLHNFYSSYELPLARKFFKIDQRGIQTDSNALTELRTEVVKELEKKCIEISQYLGGRPVAFSKKMASELSKKLGIEEAQILNISSVPQLKEVLKSLNVKLKIDRKTHKESTGEDSLNEAFAATNNVVLKDVLRTRELNKVLGTYVDAKRHNGIFYSCYSVTGTVTGRRASRKNFLGYGSNGQNQPKHSDLGKRFRGVFVARPNRVLVSCDQVQAEDWIVQGIIADVSGVTTGVDELRANVDRHQRLAAQIFGLPLDRCGKDTMERYLGKKTRHAGNYDVHGDTMSAALASEGYSVPPRVCDAILEKFHSAEPHIRNVFHKWIQQEVSKNRRLVTPFGRSRDFFGLRPYGDNGKVFREAYAYIPQSTVGDNTGKAILFCEQNRPGLVIQDSHDAVLLEVEDSFEELKTAIRLLDAAFKRTIRFQNGFELEIPIEYEIGHSLKGMQRCPVGAKTGLKAIYDGLKQQRSLQQSSISGAQQQPLVPPSNATSGSIEQTGSCTLISTQSLSPDRASEKEQL